MDSQPHEHNSVLAFRLRTYMLLGFTTLPFLLPFSIFNFLQGRYVLAVLLLSITIIANINSYSILHKNKSIISISVFHVILLAAILGGFLSIGVKVTYWCYPLVCIVYFLTDLKRARITTAIDIAALVPFALILFPFDLAIRFAITYIMTCYFADLVVATMDTLQKQLTEQAETDPLTGAYNRRHMHGHLTQAIEQHRRGLSSVSIIAIDIDHFKKVNDTLGHETGDTILKSLVSVLNKRVRKLDIIFRIGGEEFIVLARNITSDQAHVFAESLRLHVEEAKLLETMPLTISIGVASYKNNEDMDTWLRRADDFLYQAKQHGRNQVWPTQATP